MKKNVLLIIPYLTDGGAERVVSELSFALEERFNVFILLYEDRVTYPFAGKKIVLNLSHKYSLPLLKNLNLIYDIRKIKKQNNIYCSISFLVNPNLINVFTKGRDRVILTVHTPFSEYYKKKKWIDRLMNKITINLIYNRADYVVAVSKGIEDDLELNFRIKKDKLITIYNFFDFDKIRKLADEQLDSIHLEIFTKPVLINIGRLSYSKGQLNLIKAFKKIKQELDVNLVILGQGKYRDEYLRLIKMYGLENSVFLLGFQSNPYSFIKRGTLLVSSSKFEGLPMVILESIGIGTPVISTDCKCGPREILAPSTQKMELTIRAKFHEFGVLVPVAHPEKINNIDIPTVEEEEMAGAIISLLKDGETRRRYSLNGMKRADFFSVNRQVGEWIKLIERK